MGTISKTGVSKTVTMSRIWGHVLLASPILGSVAGRSPGKLARQWYERVLQRRHLASMDARMLRDIGLSPGDVKREAAKAFWRD